MTSYQSGVYGGTWAANRRAGRGRRARRERSSGRRREPCALQPWQPSLSASQRGVLLLFLCASLRRRAPAANRKEEAALRCGGGGWRRRRGRVCGGGNDQLGLGIARVARKLGRPIRLYCLLGRAFHFHVSVSPLSACLSDTWLGVPGHRFGIPYSAPLASVTARTLTRDPGGPAQFACMVFFWWIRSYAVFSFLSCVCFKFETVPIQKCSNSKLFKFETVHFWNRSNSKLFTFEIVQIWNLFHLKSVPFEICSNLKICSI
jgi:hypothetical protein